MIDMPRTAVSRQWSRAALPLLAFCGALGCAGRAFAQTPAPPATPAQQAPPTANQPASLPGGVTKLRVCADPDNLPFSNDKQEGFENKIAEIIASELGVGVEYTWWPQRRGFVRNTLRSRLCDVLLGVPNGFDPVLETTPYYRSTYYLVTRKDRNLNIASLDDPALSRLRVGVNMIGEDYTNTPPAHALGTRGIPARGYSTFYNDTIRPSAIVDAVAKGDLDVAVVWGPLAGYWAARESVPISLVPLPDSVDRTGYPMAYDIALGVRRSDKAFRARLEEILAKRRPAIDSVLQAYNVPTLARRP